MLIDISGIDNVPWQTKGACLSTDPAVFFQTKNNAQAKKICNGCPVRTQCLDWTLELEKVNNRAMISGVVGGLAAYERRLLRRCTLPGCRETARKKSVYCSEEHETENRDLKRAKYDSTRTTPERDYYMKGVIHNG